MFFDLHRHDEFSTFDGFGKATELAELAKELGHTALSTTNHGNTNGLIKTYEACKKVGIKPILGVEGYFLPKWKGRARGYHLILIAKNLKGYGNLNRIQYEGEKQKYFNPIWDFKLLEKYHEGLICTTACVAGYLAQCIIKNRLDLAEKFLLKLKSIFKGDLYIEVQPYRISEKGVQEEINMQSILLGEKLGIKCILTSDSHRGRKEDFDTYMKMHEIANHNFTDIEGTYKDRYMPTEKEIYKRFVKMHGKDFDKREEESLSKCLDKGREMLGNISEIESKCEGDYLDKLKLQLPKIKNNDENDTSFKILTQMVKKGLKERGKYKKEYIDRCKEELQVIKYHGFEDYFLIVADYVNYAKMNGIAVGPGRGSVCNCLVAYALKITEVDSYLFNLDFRRFLRKDKKKYPDIDLDFQTSRRQEIIEYLIKKYQGKAARICSYGLYSIDNLLNDLAKKCGLETDKTVDPDIVKQNKVIIASIKKFVKAFVDDSGKIDFVEMKSNSEYKRYNTEYDNILLHFSKLFGKVRYIGTHAAGVAITGGNLLDYVALRVDAKGDIYTNYDLDDVEKINVIKFDILGLKTMESISELRKATGVTVNYDKAVNDKKIISAFGCGKTDGIFQFEKQAARNILQEINCNCFNDIVATNSMNRPGPLSLKMPEKYAENKKDISEAKKSKYWQYTNESYGTIIYQEQVQQICVNIGCMTWEQADKVMKLMKGKKVDERVKADLIKAFILGARTKGLTKKEAEELFEKLLSYSFNKGHAVGYSLISIEEMFYKIYYPNEYWFCKLKYARDEAEISKFSEKAIDDESVIFLPHVNYSKAKTALRTFDGERIIQQGLSDLKGIGEKAAEFIYKERRKNGVFTSYDNFYDRCKGREVTTATIKILKEMGALEFNKKTYVNRVIKYNSSLLARAQRRG